MNKAENVPIATLSGIASLTEIAPELPLPSSSVREDVQLFSSHQLANESKKLVSESSYTLEQEESFERLLSSVNNAYLDFKNSYHDRPSVLTDIPNLPPIIQHASQNRSNIFQPHFDAYHGSPLKTNNVSSLAYSPNQRNAFIMHQQQQQALNQSSQQYSASPNSPAVESSKKSLNHRLRKEALKQNSSPDGLNAKDLSLMKDLDNKQIKVNGQSINEELNQSNEIVNESDFKNVKNNYRKKRKKKHKQKSKRSEENEKSDDCHENSIIRDELDEYDLAMRVPKLIVRKVKRGHGNEEMETLVCDEKKKPVVDPSEIKEEPMVTEEISVAHNELISERIQENSNGSSAPHNEMLLKPTQQNSKPNNEPMALEEISTPHNEIPAKDVHCSEVNDKPLTIDENSSLRNEPMVQTPELRNEPAIDCISLHSNELLLKPVEQHVEQKDEPMVTQCASLPQNELLLKPSPSVNEVMPVAEKKAISNEQMQTISVVTEIKNNANDCQTPQNLSIDIAPQQENAVISTTSNDIASVVTTPICENKPIIATTHESVSSSTSSTTETLSLVIPSAALTSVTSSCGTQSMVTSPVVSPSKKKVLSPSVVIKPLRKSDIKEKTCPSGNSSPVGTPAPVLESKKRIRRKSSSASVSSGEGESGKKPRKRPTRSKDITLIKDETDQEKSGADSLSAVCQSSSAKEECTPVPATRRKSGRGTSNDCQPVSSMKEDDDPVPEEGGAVNSSTVCKSLSAKEECTPVPAEESVSGSSSAVCQSLSTKEECTPVPAATKKRNGRSSSKGCQGASMNQEDYDPAQGCSSGGSWMRKGRRKAINYKESKSSNEDDDSDDSFKVKKTGRSRGKRKTAKTASDSSEDEYDPFQETIDRKAPRRGRASNINQPQSADSPKNVVYSEESEDNNDEEMKNFNQELETLGPKTEFKRFTYIMEKILEHEQELEADGRLDINEDVEIPPESLISKHLITALFSEIAKMKLNGKLSELPTENLVQLISIMDRHVKDTLSLSLNQDEGGEEGKRWYAIQIERIVRSAEAAAVILHITTAPNMPKQVFREEAIERVTTLCQFHLENTIYPQFDPIYKTAGESTHQKRDRRARSMGVKSKTTQKVYNKFCEVVSLMSDLLALESLTDNIILKMSQIGISPFFVEHVNILQLESLKVARAIFRHYVKHRDLILEDILASLYRLPSTKRNLRTYRLQDNEFIQMFTALVLQLIQCTVQIPVAKEEKELQGEGNVDNEVLIVKSYEDALRATRNFISVFLKKCSSSSSRDENDFRPLFENFLHDLFILANLPEWPAAEVLLTQLGRLFVVTFSNSKLDMSLRTSSLDYLSQIATHLRKASLKSSKEEEKEKLKSIIYQLINTNKDCEEVPVTDDMEIYDEQLSKALLQFLMLFSGNDPSYKYAREFYLGQWIRDVQMEVEKSMMAPMITIPGAAGAQAREEKKAKAKEEEKTSEILSTLQDKKNFYYSLIEDVTVSKLKSSYNLSYDCACSTVDHLASSRSFSKSFDLYMQQIFKMLHEQAIALRTKAVKALTMIVSVDPNILAREDVQAGVHGRLLDPSTNVREATVDLIGQFVLKCPDLIRQYYDMMIARILDTGVSVRKRVIKIFRDICVEHSDFEKIPEICAKMIRRIEDESGIQKLVTEVFRTMWFQPFKNINKESEQLYQKAVNITKVVALSKDTDWLQSLLDNLFDESENANSSKLALTASQQLVDCLFSRLLRRELKSDSNTIVSCLCTLYLFCKSHPSLLVPHAATLQPYLSSKIETPTDSLIIQHVSKILGIIVPLMEQPSRKFLAELEEDSMKLVLKQSQNVVQSCISCLAEIINKVTHNFKFIVDGFNQFDKFLSGYKMKHQRDPSNPALQAQKVSLQRALFTVGLFCRYFDLDIHVSSETEKAENAEKAEKAVKMEKTVIKDDKEQLRSEKIFDLCMYFSDFADEDISLKAILAIGFIGIRYPKLLLKDGCRNLYQEILSPLSTSTKAKFTVLKSLQNHLIEEEQRMHQNEKGTKTKKKKEEVEFKDDIKEMGDSMSGTTSEIIQICLKDIMKGFFHFEKQVRISALQVVTIILRQGLIHPAQCIPYLIAVSTDNEMVCHIKAEQCLNDLDSRYQGFIHMKAFQGVKMSYEIQTVIQKTEGGYLCGYRVTENKIALINHVYGLIRSNKQYRRPFMLSLLKQVDDVKSSIDLKYYLTENLAYIGYSTHEEPLFILYHVNKNVSVSGANILESFKELFHPPSTKKRNSKYESDTDSDEEEAAEGRKDSKLKEVNEDELAKLLKHSYGCMLLLELKKYLKTIYGFSDTKCQRYSPMERSKSYERPLNRKCDLDFVSEYKEYMFSTVKYEKMVKYYLQFKKLMMSLDKEQDSDSDYDDVKPEDKSKRNKESIKEEIESTPAEESSKAEPTPAEEAAKELPEKRSSRSSSPQRKESSRSSLEKKESKSDRRASRRSLPDPIEIPPELLRETRRSSRRLSRM